MKPVPFLFLLVPIALLLPSCQTSQVADEPLPEGLTVNFATEIAPEIEIKCLECHNSKEKHKYGGLDLETRQAALTTGYHAPIIIPGNGKGSYLVEVLKAGHADHRGMPPSPDKLLDDQIKRVITWIDEGAHWPKNFRLRRPEEW